MHIFTKPINRITIEHFRKINNICTKEEFITAIKIGKLNKLKKNIFEDYLLAKVLDKDSNSEVSLLHIACNKENLLTAKILIEIAILVSKEIKNKLINAQDAAGDTALHIVVRRNQLNLIKLLVEKGEADLHIANNFGNTPLGVAVINNALQCVEYLLGTEAIRDINKKDIINNATPLMQTVARGNVAMVKSLLKCEVIDPTIENANFTAITYAFNSACVNLMKSNDRNQVKKYEEIVKLIEKFNSQKISNLTEQNQLLHEQLRISHELIQTLHDQVLHLQQANNQLNGTLFSYMSYKPVPLEYCVSQTFLPPPSTHSLTTNQSISKPHLVEDGKENQAPDLIIANYKVT